MAVALYHWRVLLALAVTGFGLASACQGYWTCASAAAGLVLLGAACWVWCQLLATKAWMTGQPLPGPGRHRKWYGSRRMTQAYLCSGCGEPRITEWDDEESAMRGQARGLDLKCDGCMTRAVREAIARGLPHGRVAALRRG